MLSPLGVGPWGGAAASPAFAAGVAVRSGQGMRGQQVRALTEGQREKHL